MLISVVPGAALWPAAMIVWGPAYASSGHAHHCVQLVLALDGNLRVRGQGAAWVSCGAVLVRPDAYHEVEARGITVLIAFVELESDLGAALAERLKQDITPIRRREVARWRAALRGESASVAVTRRNVGAEGFVAWEKGSPDPSGGQACAPLVA